MAPAVIDLEDDDPVVAEYDVFITPELQEQVYLLQYLNRPPDHPYTHNTRSQPLEMRIKEQSGFIEVDVPMNVRSHYNRPMGVRWGEALRMTKGQGQKAYGVSSGFERVNVPRAHGGRPGQPANPAAAPGDNYDNIDEYLRNFEDANEKGHVLNKQTLGGQIMKDETGNSNYMIGTFRGGQLHLTKLNGIVQMRTQFTHLDATAQLDALARKREKEAADPTKATEPRAVQMQIKRGNAENPQTASTKNFLRHAYEEKWTKLRYYDEDTNEAYAAYAEKLFVQDTTAVPKLHSSMNNEQYLEAVSAPSSDKTGKKKPLTKRQMHAADVSDESDDPADEVQPPTTDDHMDVDEGRGDGQA